MTTIIRSAPVVSIGSVEKPPAPLGDCLLVCAMIDQDIAALLRSDYAVVMEFAFVIAALLLLILGPWVLPTTAHDDPWP